MLLSPILHSFSLQRGRTHLNYRLLKAGIMFAIPLSKGKHTAPRPSNINPLLVQLTGGAQKRVGSLVKVSHTEVR